MEIQFDMSADCRSTYFFVNVILVLFSSAIRLSIVVVVQYCFDGTKKKIKRRILQSQGWAYPCIRMARFI